uniref:solute carrier family 25 member 48 isoform X1 n=1 Tax=Callithrix jacchus TaxID=9483 RepID=UPI00159F5CF8|nr:solute carrier family 25 member 48 isoform X1 [Callithrix jacchus]
MTLGCLTRMSRAERTLIRAECCAFKVHWGRDVSRPPALGEVSAAARSAGVSGTGFGVGAAVCSETPTFVLRRARVHGPCLTDPKRALPRLWESETPRAAGHGQLPAGRLCGGLDRWCSQRHRRPPSGHSQDSPAGRCRLQEYPQLHPHSVQEGEPNLGLKSSAVALGEQPVYQGPVHCIATIVRNEGLVGLYRGASAMLLRDVPGYCLYFIPYVFLSEWITPEACAGPSPCAVWLAGGVAGAISWGTATPMDVVKSRLQADGVDLNKYKGVLDCITQSYQKEGLKGFVPLTGQCKSVCRTHGANLLKRKMDFLPGGLSAKHAVLRTPSSFLHKHSDPHPGWGSGAPALEGCS